MARDKAGHHEKITEAARQEFLTYGYAEASMRRIASAAGMSVSGLYRHFPSKEEMFSALVDPALQELMTLYRSQEKYEYEALGRGELGSQWDNGGDARMAIACIYDHPVEFKLIICKSQGTKYESFPHDLAVMEEETTMSFMKAMTEQGLPIHPVDPREFHLLVTANINAVFQAVEHDFTREEALHYADTLDRFFSKGWKELFGF